MKKRALLWVLTAIFFAGFVSAQACGDTITTNTTLTDDLLDCPGDGLIIGASDITLNCDRHTIQADKTSKAHAIEIKNHARVTIRNCNINGFARGILISNSTESIITRNSLTNVQDRAIEITDTIRSQITNNNATGNPNIGILVYNSHNNLVRLNIASNYPNSTKDTSFGIGIAIVGSMNNTITENTAEYNMGAEGIQIEGSRNNSITRNNLRHNGSHGIKTEIDSSNNTISANVILNNSRNEVVDNTLTFGSKESPNAISDSTSVNNWNGNFWGDIEDNSGYDSDNPEESVYNIAGKGGAVDNKPKKIVVFVRGDVNHDGSINLADPILILGHLFSNPNKDITCQDAADIDDDGILDISDPIKLLAYLFQNGEDPAEPFLSPGLDYTLDDLICESGISQNNIASSGSSSTQKQASEPTKEEINSLLKQINNNKKISTTDKKQLSSLLTK